VDLVSERRWSWRPLCWRPARLPAVQQRPGRVQRAPADLDAGGRCVGADVGQRQGGVQPEAADGVEDALAGLRELGGEGRAARGLSAAKRGRMPRIVFSVEYGAIVSGARVGQRLGSRQRGYRMGVKKPSRSDVRAIMENMTPDEYSRLRRHWSRMGLWFGMTGGVPAGVAYVCWGTAVGSVAALMVLLSFASIPVSWRIQRRFLCETRWAREHGFGTGRDHA
jgi:hypothetical protein